MKAVSQISKNTATIERELGRLAEAVENGKEDRVDLKRAMEKVGDIVGELQQAVHGLTQSIQSMTAQVVSLSSEKCGQRLDAIELKNKHYDRILGSATSFLWKVIVLIMTAAACGGGAAKFVERFF